VRSAAPLRSMSSAGDALLETIRAAVRAELKEHAALSSQLSPEYVDRSGLARELSVSLPIVDRLCREGMPYVTIATVRRFRVAAVREWLESRENRGAR
jgi:hypothetical protein